MPGFSHHKPLAVVAWLPTLYLSFCGNQFSARSPKQPLTLRKWTLSGCTTTRQPPLGSSPPQNKGWRKHSLFVSQPPHCRAKTSQRKHNKGAWGADSSIKCLSKTQASPSSRLKIAHKLRPASSAIVRVRNSSISFRRPPSAPRPQETLPCSCSVLARATACSLAAPLGSQTGSRSSCRFSHKTRASEFRYAAVSSSCQRARVYRDPGALLPRPFTRRICLTYQPNAVSPARSRPAYAGTPLHLFSPSSCRSGCLHCRNPRKWRVTLA